MEKSEIKETKQKKRHIAKAQTRNPNPSKEKSGGLKKAIKQLRGDTTWSQI